ncbi:MAG: hypothetical protein GF317_18620 [Candidatus Lokiarchaeota archaeon]|nr:hypothetical protein [Candidatus Lokiarchaeota archaeon]MBD3201531.1 hypothetical protein [Candidatus Lokiarchaeota archaeon]
MEKFDINLMSYTPINDGIYSIFIVYLILIVSSIYLITKMILKWRERKVTPPLYLSIVFVFLALGIILLAIGLLETMLTGYFKEIYRATFPLAYCSVVIADIFLYIFTTKMTESGEKAIIPLSIVGLIIIILILLPWNWWGIPHEETVGQLNIRTYSTLAFALYSVVIYSIIAIISKKAQKRAEDKVSKTGFKLLFYSVISMIGFFIMVTIDNLLITLTDHPGYSEFVYIGWAFALAFVLLSYMSLIMPNWLKKRLNLEE